jgi:hypothetical protein
VSSIALVTALVLSVVSLMISAVAFAQLSAMQKVPVSEQIQKQIRLATQEAQTEKALSDLSAIRTKIAAGAPRKELSQDIQQIRENLRAAFARSEANAAASWKAVDGELATVQDNLLHGVVNVLDTLDSAITKLRTTILSD